MALATALSAGACQEAPEQQRALADAQPIARALTATQSALADTYVRDGSDSPENFGTSTFLEVKRSTTFGLNRISYLRFSLGGFTGTVHKARLRLWGLVSTAGSVPVVARMLPDNAFAENTVTFDTKPGPTPIELARTTVSSTTGQWYEWDITPLVREKKRNGDASIELQLHSLVNTNPVARLNSREAANNRPQLVIDTATALFVVGNTTLGPGDAAVRNRLQQLGYEVTVVAAATATGAAATGKTLVVISSTGLSADVNTKFRDVAVPVVVWEENVFDDMKLTGTVSGTDFGATASQTAVKIVNGRHALAAGREGTVTSNSSSGSYVWGRPGASAQKVATLNADGTRWTVFGYEQGASMVGMTAPARRVGLFFTDNTAASLTRAGWLLFDAAITWAAGARPFVVKKVLVLNYDPIVPSSGLPFTQHMPTEGFAWNDTRRILEHFLRDIPQASGDYLRYQVVEIRDLNEWVPFLPPEPPYTAEEYIQRLRAGNMRPVSADYDAIINAQGIDQGINSGAYDEVFIAAAHSLGLAESRMAGPSAYHVNSDPLFRPTNRNYMIEFMDHSGGVASFHHGYVHRMEWIMRRAYARNYGQDAIFFTTSNWNTTPYDRPCSYATDPSPCSVQRRHFWDRFTLVEGIARNLRNQGDTAAVAGVGTAHYTPNALEHQRDNYNWGQDATRLRGPVISSSDDWLYNFPNLTGETRSLEITEWFYGNDHERGFMLWFLNHYPRARGRHSDGVLYNWWEYAINFDDYLETRL